MKVVMKSNSFVIFRHTHIHMYVSNGSGKSLLKFLFYFIFYAKTDLVWLLQVQMKWFYLIEIVPIRISELLKLGRYDVGFGLYELKYDKFGIALLSSEMNIMFCLWSIGNGFLLSM